MCKSYPVEPYDNEDRVASLLGSYKYQSTTVKVTRGDYAPLMQRMIENFEKAKVFIYYVMVDDQSDCVYVQHVCMHTSRAMHLMLMKRQC